MRERRPEQIARVTLRLDRSCERVCNIPAPSDGLEAKFSLRQTVAMALSGIDTASLAAYSAASATDPALVMLREKVALDFQEGWPQAAAEIEVALGDGRVLRAGDDAGIPASDIAGQGERLAAKFAALAGPVVGPARARELRATIVGPRPPRRCRRAGAARGRVAPRSIAVALGVLRDAARRAAPQHEG